MINVMIPTFDRPESLKRAVRSVFAQSLLARYEIRIIIVDNTPSGSAASAIEDLKRECPEGATVIALQEPRPGVANARNAAMQAVTGTLVACLDDDQAAPVNWLEQLLAAYTQTPAAVTFGPVQTVLPDGITKHHAYYEAFFARTHSAESGYIDASYGCGNALIDFAQIEGTAPWFDAKMNETGGEDDLLFQRVRLSGRRFAWAADACVFEHPPTDRVTMRYTLKRAFSYGQAPITLAIKGTPVRYGQIPIWMGIGAGKALWHGLKWIALCAIRHKRRAFELNRAVHGISKLFWWVDLKFYGRAALKPAAPAQTTSQDAVSAGQLAKPV